MNETSNHTDKKTTPSEWSSLFFNDDKEKLLLNDDGTRKSEYLSSDNGKQELLVEDKIDEWSKQLDEKVKRGEISQEEAYKEQDKALDAAIDEIDAIRNGEYERQRKEQAKDLASVFQQILDKKKSAPTSEPPLLSSEPTEPLPPTPILEPAPWPSSSPLPPTPILAPTPESSPEPLPPTPVDQEDESDHSTPEEIELAEVKRLIEENDRALEANRKRILEYGPLPAISVEYDEIHDEELASDLAERDLKREIDQAGRIKKLWKDRLFRKHYLKRYTNEYMVGKRTVKNVHSDGEALDVHEVADLYNSVSQKIADATSQTSESYTDLLFSSATGDTDEDSSKMTSDILHAMVDYSIAKSNLQEGESAEDLEKELIEKLHSLTKTHTNGETRNNYLEVANQIDKLIKLDIPIEQVTERFKAYNAKLISARDESQRFNLNRIFARIEYDAGVNLD